MALNAQNRENIIEICRILAEKENLKVTVKEAAKGALYTGLGVFFGAVLAGPVGMAIGGVVTSIAVAVNAQGKFKSVAEIIVEMNDDQKRRLTLSVQRAMQNVKPQDCVGLLTLALTSASVKEVILAELATFLKDEFQLQMLR